jgi:hypothetical protein
MSGTRFDAGESRVLVRAALFRRLYNKGSFVLEMSHTPNSSVRKRKNPQVTNLGVFAFAMS